MRPGAEREVRGARPFTLGAERGRLVVEARIAMGDERADQQERPRRHVDAVELDVDERAPVDEVDGRVEAKHLRQYELQVLEPCEVARGRRAAIQDGVELLVHPRLYVGMPREEVPGPGERSRRGVNGGHQQGRELVGDFRVVEVQQQRQRVVAPGAAVSPFGDGAPDRLVDRPARPREPAAGGPRQPGSWNLVQHRRERRHERAGLGLEVEGEERLRGRREREAAHLGAGVDGLSVAPAGRRPLGRLDQALRLAGEASSLERGL